MWLLKPYLWWKEFTLKRGGYSVCRRKSDAFFLGGVGVGVEKVLNVCLLFAFNSHDHHNYNELFKFDIKTGVN